MGEVAQQWLETAQRRMNAMKKKHNEAETAAPDQPDKRQAIPELNEASLIGRLVGDPRITDVAGGYKRVSFMLAVPHTFLKSGEKVQTKNYVPVVAWRAIAQQCEGVGKGDAVQVDGRIKTWSKDEKFHWEVEASMFQLLEKAASAPAESQRQTETAAA
jgi:single-stranded DNA-binding protein